jgi:hypothetical protein
MYDVTKKMERLGAFGVPEVKALNVYTIPWNTAPSFRLSFQRRIMLYGSAVVGIEEPKL